MAHPRLNQFAQLVPFSFSTGDSFVLEFTDGFIRFFKNHLPIMVGPAIFEIASPYAEADLANLRFLNLNDVVYISHATYRPRRLNRLADDNWTIGELVFLDGPYLPVNATDTTVSSTGTSGTVTLTASTGIFAATDVNRLIRRFGSNLWGYAEITAFSSPTQVTANVISPFGNTTASTNWRLGSWSDTTSYPAVVYIFEGRLGWAGGTFTPLTFDMSVTGDFVNMAPTKPDGQVTNDSALQFQIGAGQQNEIRWVTVDEKGLLAGTAGGEWTLLNQAANALSAENLPNAKLSTTYGSAQVEPLRIGKATIFAQRAKRKLREFAYVFEFDGFKAPDLTLLAEHITLGQIKDMVYQQDMNLVWIIMETGELWAMTYDRDQNVIGFHQHILGGADVKVESVTVIPATDTLLDELYLSVSRTIDGATSRILEYMVPVDSHISEIKEAYFHDAGVRIDLGSPGLVASGLDHLEGETVSVLVDGSPQPPVTVIGGSITFQYEGTLVQTGLPYVSQMKTLRVEAGSATGTAQGKTKRIHNLHVRLHETVGLSYGREFDELDIQELRTSEPMDTAILPFSGDIRLQFQQAYDKAGQVCIAQTQPLPCTVLALMLQLTTYDNR